MSLAAVASLLRPLVLPTAVADAFLGAGVAMVALGSVVTAEKLALASLLSLLLYAFGLVLNDLADEGRDRAAGAARPLASGTVSRRAAYALLVLTGGGALALVLFFLPAPAAAAAGMCVAFIVLYDFTHARFPILSPFLMGGARAADVLAAAAVFGLDVASLLANPVVLCFVVSYGLYTAAVTFASLMEDDPEDKAPFLFAWIAAGLACLVLFPVTRFEALSWYFYLFLLVAGSFFVTLPYVVLSRERLPRLRWYVPMWITPLCLLGGIGLHLLSAADLPGRFLLPGLALAALYPLLTVIMYARMSRAAAAGNESEVR